MKRLLVLALLSIPVGESASCPSNVDIVSESWSYYCNGTAKHLRLTLIVDVHSLYSDFSEATDLTCEIHVLGADGNTAILDVVSATKLAGNLHQLVCENSYPHPMTSLSLRRDGGLHWRCNDGDIDPWLWLHDSGELFTATDATCSPLPVAQSTWGAVKALYR